VTREELRVAPLEKRDLNAVARVHIAAFEDSALSKIGREAVRRYYLWQLEGPHDVVALGAWRGEILVGFCFAGTFRGALMGFLARNRPFLLRRVLARPWLLWNPLFRDRIFLALRVLARRLREKATKRKQQNAAPMSSDVAQEIAPRFGILAIGVDPKAQGGGVGRALMEACENEAWRWGFEKMNLSVHPSNVQAVTFYEKQGWMRIAENGAWNGAMKKQNPKRTEKL